MVTIGLYRTVSEINGDIRRKSHENRQFPHPVYLTPPLNGFPLELCIGRGSQETRIMVLSEGRKGFQIGLGCLAVLIQYRNVTDSQPANPARHVAVAITCLLRRAGKTIIVLFSK